MSVRQAPVAIGFGDDRMALLDQEPVERVREIPGPHGHLVRARSGKAA